MTQTIRRSDQDLQTNVTDELSYNPSVDAAHVGVAAHDGVVTLSGDVGSLPERHAANRAAMRISGVKAVNDDIRARISHVEDMIGVLHDVRRFLDAVTSFMTTIGAFA